MASRRPEEQIAVARRITEEDVKVSGTLKRGNVGRWAVVNGTYYQLCKNYTEAARIASSLNRSPA